MRNTQISIHGLDSVAPIADRLAAGLKEGFNEGRFSPDKHLSGVRVGANNVEDHAKLYKNIQSVFQAEGVRFEISNDAFIISPGQDMAEKIPGSTYKQGAEFIPPVKVNVTFKGYQPSP